MSGITTQKFLTRIQEVVVKDMTTQLAGLPMKKATREDLIAGAQDGMRMLLHHLKEAGVIEIVESVKDGQVEKAP